MTREILSDFLEKGKHESRKSPQGPLRCLQSIGDIRIHICIRCTAAASRCLFFCQILDRLGNLVHPVLIEFLVLLVGPDGKLLKGSGIGEPLDDDLVGDVIYDACDELLAHVNVVML